MVPWWLEELAKKKLGARASVFERSGEWIAERKDGVGRTRVTGKSHDILVWFLEQMPDRGGSDAELRR